MNKPGYSSTYVDYIYIERRGLAPTAANPPFPIVGEKTGRFFVTTDIVCGNVAVFMYVQHYFQQSMDQPSMVANPTCGQLNREKFAPENLVSRDRFSRPFPRQPAHLDTQRLNLVLTHGIPPDFRGGVHLFIPPCLHSRVDPVTHWRTDGVHCREFAGTWPAVLKVVPVTGAAFQISP